MEYNLKKIVLKLKEKESPRLVEEEYELEFWKISSHSHLIIEFHNA